MEDQFITIGKGNGKDDITYKMNPAAKDLLDNFMLARNNALLWGKCNVDKNGKAKIFDEDGQPKQYYCQMIMGGLKRTFLIAGKSDHIKMKTISSEAIF